MFARVKKFFVRQEGATMVEYGLMLFLIAVACVIVVTTLGTTLKGVFNTIVSNL
jgi:pilus assembly protein Flp/PilA